MFFVKSKRHSLSTACNDACHDDYSQQSPNFHHQKETWQNETGLKRIHVENKSAKNTFVDNVCSVMMYDDDEVKSAVFLWSLTVLGAFIHIRLPAPSQLYHVLHQNDHNQPPPPTTTITPLPLIPFVIIWFTLIEMPLNIKWLKSFLASSPSALFPLQPDTIT